MGREVRMVPADWRHPRYPDDYHEPACRGRYIPLYDRGFADHDREWSEGWAMWQKGLVRSYGDEGPWRARTPEDGALFSHYEGSRPSPDDFMPDWPEDQRTHLMMYEDTTEGTPISPAFATPEELARWLADTGASAFGSMTATYEEWLRVCRGAFAPSLVMSSAGIQSGVAAASEAGEAGK